MVDPKALGWTFCRGPQDKNKPNGTKEGQVLHTYSWKPGKRPACSECGREDDGR